MERPRKISWRLIIAVSTFIFALVLLIVLSHSINQVKAENHLQVTPPAEPTVTFIAPTGPAPTPLNNCVTNYCTGGVPNCTAHDATLANVFIADVKDACEYWGDYGIYQFMTNCTSNSSERYDPFMWFALDGGDGQTGTCGYGYMGGGLIAKPANPPTIQIGPPFYDLEYSPAGGSADQCGDILSNVHTHARTPYYSIYCTPGFMNGEMGAIFTWDNNLDTTICDATHPNCPATASKCFTGPITFESVAHPVDLAIDIVAGGYGGGATPNVDPGEVFYYDITVSNVSANMAQGYNIFVDLPIWLKIVPVPGDPKGSWFPKDDGIFVTAKYYEDSPSAITGFIEKGTTYWDGPWGDRTAEYCSGVTGGCKGYGDIVRFNIMTDLPGNSSHPAYRIYTQMYTHDDVYCTANPNDPRCSLVNGVPVGQLAAQLFGYPAIIQNGACTWPFDREPTFGGCQDPIMCNPAPVAPSGGTWTNNCDTVNVPTKVKLAYFNASADEKGILLKWETTQELNNLGFNIYRSTSPFFSTRFGTVKLNSSLIPSANPGGNVGAAYSFEDNTAQAGVKYYYWLEDVEFDGKVNRTGPVNSTFELKVDPIGVAPGLNMPGAKP